MSVVLDFLPCAGAGHHSLHTGGPANGLLASVYYLLPDRLRVVPLTRDEAAPFLGDYLLKPEEQAIALYRLDGFAELTFADGPVFRYYFEHITIGAKPPRLFPPGLHGEAEEID